MCALALGGCGSKPADEAPETSCPPATPTAAAPGSTTTSPCGVGTSVSAGTSVPGGPELWKGPVTGHGTYPGCSPAEPVVTGEVVMSVDADGAVTGHATEDIAAYECGGVAADPPPNTWQITGTKTADAFQLSVQGRPLRMDINDGRRASAKVDTWGAGGYGATVTYSVECANCR